MNPIENCWDLLDCHARKRQVEILDEESLWKILKEEEEKIDKFYIQKIFNPFQEELMH